MLIFLLICCAPTNEQLTRCNGQSFLCDRPLDSVSFAATHNSMSSQQEEWLAPNHFYGISQQLEDGIRGLNLDTYLWEDQAYLCHGFCELGATPLVDEFQQITLFLENNPQEILLITFQSALDAARTEQAFQESGLLPYLYHHVTGHPWPTSLTTSNKIRV